MVDYKKVSKYYAFVSILRIFEYFSLDNEENVKGFFMTSTVNFADVFYLAISSDAEPRRFELFCAELLEKIENRPFVPTSYNYDQGRDGRSLDNELAVCTTLQKKLSVKQESDVENCCNNSPSLKHIYYCFSTSRTEYELDERKQELQQVVLDTIKITLLDGRMLARYADRHKSIIEKYYRAEIDEIIKMQTEGSPSGTEAETLGLKLSLCTIGQMDSASIRDQLYRDLILVSLNSEYRSIAGISQSISNQLRLSRQISSELIFYYLGQLAEKELCQKQDSYWVITERGKEHVLNIDKNAESQGDIGRKAVHKQLRDLLDEQVADSQIGNIWKELEGALGQIFHMRGVELLSSVSSLIYSNSEDSITDEEDTDNFYDLLKTAIKSAAAYSADRDLRAEIETALFDIFRERQGPAFEWLSAVCVNFVILCSLGIETSVEKQIKATLSTIDLAFDTDVLLALLCESEKDNESINNILRKWREIGGKLYFTSAVTIEVATHGWNAKTDFFVNSSFLPGTELQCDRLCETAFLRSFCKLWREKKVTKGQWRPFINSFLGPDKGEDSRIIETLIQDYGFSRLDESDNSERQDEIRDYIVNLDGYASNSYDQDRFISYDKAKRDAEFINSVLRAIEIYSITGTGRRIMILTSADLLKRAGNHFSKSVGLKNMVQSVAAISYLLTFIPGVSLGLTTLKSMLFDTKFRGEDDKLLKLALKVIAASDKVSLPWAKRTTLKRTLKDNIFNVAKQKNISRDKLRLDIIDMKNTDDTISVIANAIDDAAPDYEAERELMKARKLIEDMKKIIKED